MQTLDISKYNIFGHDDAVKIAKLFIRKCPKKKEYIERLNTELTMIIEKKLTTHIFRVCEVMNLLIDIPHIIRGSSGSSLVCYLLGITNIDPVKEDICFSRFLNSFRSKLPDFDIDIPHIKHDKAFKLIDKKWGNQVARISNHVTYGEKGAIRKAIKELGYTKRVPKSQCNLNFFKDEDKKQQLIKLKEKYKGTFKCYSLHCGGIIFSESEKGFSDEQLIKSEDSDINQVKYNKDDIEDKNILKIDILSNRGLTQLFSISKTPIEDYVDEDPKTFELLCKGKNLGLTFGESPAMRKVLCLTKPKNIMDIAKCLAIIRPMASDAKRYDDTNMDDLESNLIFDDDAINYITKLVKCNEELGDKYRRAFSKGNWKEINSFLYRLDSDTNKNKVKDKLLNLKKYSFCKSHAISYAKLVYALAYQKTHNPKQFWLSTINNCHSMYRDWVHMREAKLSGLELTFGDYPWKIKDNKLVSVNKKSRKEQTSSSIEKQFQKYGYWINDEFYPNCKIIVLDKNTAKVKFCGLIATGRWCRKWNKKDKQYKYFTYVTIGYQNGYYIDLVIDKWQSISSNNLIEGIGHFKEYDKESSYGIINVTECKLF